MPDPTTIPALDAGQYLAVADAHANAAAWTHAAEVSLRAVTDHPTDARLWAVLGTAAWALDDWPTARHALETADLYGPLRPLARLALADAYLALGRPEEAVPVLTFLTEPGRCGTDLLPYVAGRLFRAGVYETAANVCRRVIRTRPRWAEGYYQYAACLWALDAGGEDLFVPLYEAVVLAPGEPKYALALADVWVGAGCPAEAAAVLASVDPGHVAWPGSLLRMAAVFQSAGVDGRASACVRRVQAVSEDRSPLLCHEG